MWKMLQWLSLGMLPICWLLSQPVNAASTERVSLSSSGREGNENSGICPPSITPDGRFITFCSYATNLVTGDTNDFADVFLHDRKTGKTERISINSEDVEARNGESSKASVSANGRFVVFASDANNLVRGDTNQSRDIFVRDRTTGITERVSVNSKEVQGDSHSYTSSISADGRFIAFDSYASNFGASGFGNSRLFIRDRLQGTTTMIADLGSEQPSLSPNGRFVAFTSNSRHLVPGEANGYTNIFVFDRTTNAMELVSVNSAGAATNDHSSYPSISADGRFVSFQSDATNLVAGDTNASSDIFVRDRSNHTTERVSINSAGAQTEGTFRSSQSAAISADGRFVAYESGAVNLVAGDTNNAIDVFLRDRWAGLTERVSVSSSGGRANGSAGWPSISASGRFVAFDSAASNLAPKDLNTYQDAFLRDRSPGRNDLLVDFGAAGLSRMLNNTGRFVQIHDSSPVAIATGDLDGSFKDEAIASFAGLGLLARYNDGGSWKKLHDATPSKLITGDLDGNGMDELIVIFADRVAARYNNAGGWVKLWGSAAEDVATGDVDGNGKKDLIADFGSVGLMIKRNNATTWGSLHTLSVHVAIGDLDGNGRDEVIVDQGPAKGIWVRYNDVDPWVRVSTATSQGLATGDLDGDGKDELLVDFGAGGLQARYNNVTPWKVLETRSPIRFLTADLDGNGKAEVVASFTGAGIRVRSNNVGPWTTLSGAPEQGMAAAAFD